MAAPTVTGFSLLRAALLGTTALILVGPTTASARVGVTSATDGDPLGKPPAEAERVLRIGIDVQANEVITTSSNDRAHLVFLDGTSLTVGPNAQLTIDKFVYDPNTKTGELVVNASKGVLRLVGGKISKTTPITITTPASTIGIRGGITLLEIQPTKTTSTFVFGNNMTVTGGGQTQNVTRPGSQVTTTAGGSPGQPTLVGQGALVGQMSQLEGKSGGGTQGNNPGSTGGPGGGNADQGAQQFSRQNNGPPSGSGGPPTGGTTQPDKNPNANQPPPGINPDKGGGGGTPPSPTTTTTTRVIITTSGRFLADPAYDGSTFNSTTLRVTPNNLNNMALASTGNLTTTVTKTNNVQVSSTSRVVLTLSDNRTINLPWQQGTMDGGFPIGSFTDPVFGTISGTGYVSPSGDYFAYVFTDTNNKKVGFIGGTPTPQTGPNKIPTSGYATFDVTNLGDAGRLPFAPQGVGDDVDLKANKSVSKLYAAYSANNTLTLGQAAPTAARSTEMQATLSIAGQGANQKSYMGVFIGEFLQDANNGTVANSGNFNASYRLGANQQIGRITSAASTPDTGNGNAIFGANGAAMVFTPDSVQTTFTTGGVGGTVNSITTQRLSQASYNQPSSNLVGNDYFAVTAASGRNSLTPGAATSQTLNGFVGGVVEQNPGGSITTRTIGTVDAAPGDVTLVTDRTSHRASATINVQHWDGSTSASFKLGGTTGDNASGANASTSAFIDDNTYALLDRPAGVLTGTTSVSNGCSTSTGADVTSSTVMVSYNANPTTLTNLYTAAGVTPCTCAFLTWGWWGGDISYSANSVYNANGHDRLNLALYVAGTLTTTAQLPNTGTATYAGHAIGNVVNGPNSYVAVGSYAGSWSFASQSGTSSINNFDGGSYSAPVALVGGTVQFTGALTGSGGAAGRTGAVSGAFFSNGAGNPVAGQAGSFSISGAGYKAGGIFAGQKQ